jgi:GT2 family glycosyltransferase
MKYSIIISAFKNTVHTSECLDSLIPYLTSDTECIVIDDGSHNEMAQLLRSYEEKHPSIHALIHTDNKGLIIRRNEGIRQAKGEYVLFLDNDTVWSGNVLSYLSGYMNTLPECGIVGMCGVLMPSHTASIHIHQSNLTKPLEVHAVTGYCLFVRRELLQKGVIFDEHMTFMLHEDIDFCFEARSRGYQVYAIPNVPLVHKEHGTLQYYQSSHSAIFAQNWNYFVHKWKNAKDLTEEYVLPKLNTLIQSGRKIIKTSEIADGAFFDLQ